MYKKGTKVKMTSEAVENYGEKWRGVELVVIHRADKYMPAQEFYAKGRPEGYHPGYDEGVSPMSLYDLKRADTGEELSFSLYDYEIEP